MPRATGTLALVLASALLSAMLPSASAIRPDPAAGYCVMVGVDEAPWDNWIVAWTCGAFPGFSGWTCTGESLVWACVGEDRDGTGSTGATIEHLPSLA